MMTMMRTATTMIMTPATDADDTNDADDADDNGHKARLNAVTAGASTLTAEKSKVRHQYEGFNVHGLPYIPLIWQAADRTHHGKGIPNLHVAGTELEQDN